MHYPALLSLLAASVSAIIIEPITPIDPIIYIPTHVTLPGWPACPNQCVLAVQAVDTTMTAGEEQVCFAEPAHEAPCSYYYCCGNQPVTCGLLKEVCVPGTFDTTFWVPPPSEIRPEPQPED